MKELQLQTSVKVYSYHELEPELARLVDLAKAKTQDAYPSGLCAERVTLFAANANHPNTPVVALALACYTHGHFTKDVASPCGACRQVMLETETRFATPMKVILYCEEGCYVFDKASDLLPMSFAAENLEG